MADGNLIPFPRAAGAFMALVQNPVKPEPTPAPAPSAIWVDPMARVWIDGRVYRQCGTSTAAARVMSALAELERHGALPSPEGYPAKTPKGAP